MIRWMVCLFLINTPQIIYASQPDRGMNPLVKDTLPTTLPIEQHIFADDTAVFTLQDSSFFGMGTHVESITPIETIPFKPDPKKAWKAAAIFPGVGQIYNRQYWKLPIVYGGFMGCAYAISWNNRTYQDYKNAYYSIMRDSKADPKAENPENWSDDWMVFVPGGADPASYLNNSSFYNNLKRGKDYFRRFRDLSIIITAGFYLICVADAYVDAQMFDFDISPDLSFHVTPGFLPETLYHARSYGVNICMTF